MKKGWKNMKLGDVADVIHGKCQKEVISEHGQYPIYGSGGNIMGYANEYICEAGTTILGRKGSINNPQFISSRFWNVDTAFGISAKSGYDNKFIFYFIKNIDWSKKNTGTTLPSLTQQVVKSTPIPVPSLPEQQRIVSYLDAQFAKIDQLKENAERQLQTAKDLWQKALNEMLNPQKEWEVKTIPQISINLDSKRIPITSNKRESGIYPYYGASGIVDYVKDYIFDDTLLLISEDGANLIARVTPIAFSIKGKCWVNNHAHVLKIENDYLRRYIEYYFANLNIREYITGAAQPKLTQGALNKIGIYIPQKESELESIVLKLDNLSSNCNHLQTNYTKIITLCNDLKQSLLKQIFE